jgi:glycosyltransferase involved in cell wall biosynthesis
LSEPEPHILYVGAILPKRSETFVYREVLGLRERGLAVSIASVHPPGEDDLAGDPQLKQLAEEAVPIYGRGRRDKLAVYRDAVRQSFIRRPKGFRELKPSYWPKYQFQWEAGYALAQRVQHHGITHIHAHMAHVPTTIAMACAEALELPFSFTGHAADLFRDRSALRTKLRAASFVACISEWHRRFYQRLVPELNEVQLPIIRCGVDIDEFAPVDPAAADGRELLAVGRLVPKKGFDVLLRAIAAVDVGHDAGDGASAADLRLTLVGEGPEEQKLRGLVKELNLTNRVTFTGSLPNAEVRDRMARAGVFVLPCREAADGDRDGIPVVLMEAMARNVAVVSGDLPTIRELVTDNVTGVMVRPGAVDELREALTRLADDAPLRRRLADAGRARVAEEFSLAVTLDRLETAFSAAARPAPPAAAVAEP